MNISGNLSVLEAQFIDADRSMGSVSLKVCCGSKAALM